MNYQEKMTHHLRLAEKRGAQADALEAVALKACGINDPDAMNTIDAYRMKKETEHNELLRQRSGARDLQIRLATMYGIAALVKDLGRGQAIRELLNRP